MAVSTSRGRRRCIAALIAFAAGAGIAAPGSASGAGAPWPALGHLTPGAFLDVHQDVPVTVVFVGHEAGPGPAGIDVDRFLARQLPSARIVDRTTRFFEQQGYLEGKLEPAAIGLTLDYRYETVFADQQFEDALFAHLSSIAFGRLPPTILQQLYSAQAAAAAEIRENWVIDAVEVERWLAANAGPLLGVDTTKPTVFFLNWWGRPDFRFHTYGYLGVKPFAPFPVGTTQLGQMIAWGGTPPDGPDAGPGPLARVWFHDLSAGPDYTTAGWLLEGGDFNGDGVTDNRLPPVWEYGTTHWYRPFDDLTGDLAGVLRFAAVDAMFGASPVYDPALSEPLLPDTVELDLNMFAGVPGRDPRSTLHLGAVQGAFSRVDPTRAFPIDVEVRPLDGRVAQVHDCMVSLWGPAPRSCFGNVLDPFTELDNYFIPQANRYLDGTRYEVPVAFFDLPRERVGGLSGLASLGPANVQGWAYVWISALNRERNTWDTEILTHEVGHHLGFSHLHDGYDAGLDLHFAASDGAFWFATVGTEVYSTMSYLPNTVEFGQFDRDNLDRWQVAGRLDGAQRILGDVARSRRAARASAAVAAADEAAGLALAGLATWDLRGASAAAADAYHLVLQAAAAAGVHVEPWSGVADESSGAGAIGAAIDTRDRLLAPLPAGAPSIGERYVP